MEGLEHRPKRTEWLFAYIKNGIESHADKPMAEKVNKKERKMPNKAKPCWIESLTFGSNTMTFMRVLQRCYHHFSALIHCILLPFLLKSWKTIFLFVFTIHVHTSDKNRIRFLSSSLLYGKHLVHSSKWNDRFLLNKDVRHCHKCPISYHI